MRFSRCAGSIIVVVLSLFIEINSFPSTTISSTSNVDLVVSTANETTTPATLPSEAKLDLKPIIRSMHVESNVSSRYANTLVTSRVANPAGKANEVTFSIVIPETAFITGFNMEIEGKVYEAYIKEKAEAKKVYENAVSSGQAAAHVAVQARDSNHFTVSVNLEPESKAIFRLRYEELLTRRLGLYNLVVNLNPGQIVDDLTVDVDIQENSPITKILVPELRTGNEIDAQPTDAQNQYASTILTEDNSHAKVHFSPNKEQQMELIKLFKAKNAEISTPPPYPYSSFITNPIKEPADSGVSGQFVVQYDVNRNVNGEVLVNDGYFVHFFAPDDLKPLSKHVIFVLDVSGSMAGRKINQLKEAMESILQNLNPGDFFNIMDFSYGAKVYNLDDPNNHAIYKSISDSFYGEPIPKEKAPEVPPKPQPATPENIKKAKEIIQQLHASGGTNINDALTTALKIANYGIAMQESSDVAQSSKGVIRHEPMIIFLTDGDPTVGETNTKNILSAVTKLNTKKTAIFSLAFGEDADRNFLRKISLKNYGFLRHIYEAADAAQQLKHFYRQISSPLLANITYTYPIDQIDDDSVTKKVFEHFFMGSEIIIAGKLLKSQVVDNSFKISADSVSGPIDYIPNLPEEKKKKEEFWPLEKLWAYLTVKQLLDQSDSDSEKSDDPKSPEKKALAIALKYSFVTSLTSLVVVKPNSSSAVDAESLQSTQQPAAYPLSGIPLMLGGFGGQSGAYGAPAPASAYSPSSYSGGGFVSNRASSASSASFSTQFFPMKRMPLPTYHYFMRQPVQRIAHDSYNIGSRISDPVPVQDNLESVAIEEEQGTFDSDIVPLLPPARTTTFTPFVELPKPCLSKYKLENYTWLEQYLSDKENTIQIPTANKSNATYKLKTITDTMDDLKDAPCENSFGGGSGVCKYLTECEDLAEAFKDLVTYLNYSCDTNGYAGVCCKAKVR
ncbi:inter-alpha-trypsin inhibitor heavy chain H4-like isoform X3 [Arctopsyche grandis]|uniref:inter-alpha-trypsin inhibitor heavy chain H4-like isoform X3 n=1 Tax=Arctopsyche grandis TaxID=121162 RepID=UPI00406D7A51